MKGIINNVWKDTYSSYKIILIDITKDIIFIDRNIKASEIEHHDIILDIVRFEYTLTDLSQEEINVYNRQIIEGEFDREYETGEYSSIKKFRERRYISDFTEQQFKDCIVSAAKAIIKKGNVPNLSILKKVFDVEELRFYFPDLFPKTSSPPVFIGKAHVGDAQIAGGDIVGGSKTGDVGMLRGGVGSADKSFSNCPYCGEALNLPKTPKFCPYCGAELR